MNPVDQYVAGVIASTAAWNADAPANECEEIIDRITDLFYDEMNEEQRRDVVHQCTQLALQRKAEGDSE